MTRLVPDHLWVAEALLRLAESTNETGTPYFHGLVSGLADVFSVRWVYLSRLHPDMPGHVQVVAAWADGQPAPLVDYSLADTPCAEVMTGSACFYPTGVADAFPRDRMLADMGIDSYAGTPLCGADGRAKGLLTIMHDRPLDPARSPCRVLELVAGRAAAELERSRVEAQLRQRESQIRFLSESNPAMLWSATPDGRLDYLSPRAAEYCGAPLDSLLGLGYVAYIHPDDIALKLEAWNRALQTGEPFEAEYRLRGVDGAYRWQLTRARAERDATGSIERWHGSVVDVDDRRRAEEALRTEDRRKDEFLAMLAHELRNPLAPLRHALAVQARAGDDLRVWREMAQTMERQVAHMVRLVDDLLDVSRLTTGRITLRCEPLDLRDVVADALETCRDLLETRQHRTTVSLPSDRLMVDGDRIRLVQVMTNLLNNAAKFTEPGGDIDVEAACRNGAIEVRVRDSGIGIAEERLASIFDLFSQSDPSPDRKHGGLGVGLTLALRLIDLHSGELTASSGGPGRGSEFLIRLPAMTAVAADRDRVAPPVPRSTNGSTALRVLVIDDYKDTASALDRLLRSMGHVVSIANDGRSGIDLADRFRPDVVLLDIGLPLMDGYAVARHLRSLPGLAATRIIALTGYGHSARAGILEAGIDRHLVKPVDADELEAAIHGVPAG